jgi:hypothetical protein
MRYTQMNIGEGWTRTHGFFVSMGGFHFYAPRDSDSQKHDPGTRMGPLDREEVMERVKNGEIDLPLEEEIQDKSKTDWLAKTLVLLQTGWFVVQCIARGIAHLPLSELEVITLAYTIMNVGIYAAWWNKPRNVDRPVRVYLPKEMEGVRRAGEIGEDAFSDIGMEDGWDYIFSLIPGLSERDDAIGLYSSVSTFYSGEPNSRQDFFQSGVVASAVGAVFGAIHCIAWSSPFPSYIEQLLWRISSMVMIALPVSLLAGSWGMILLYKFKGRGGIPFPQKIFIYSLP